MKELKNYGVQELNTKEIETIEGGKNLIEYFAQGIGWCVGQIVNGAEAVADAWSDVPDGYINTHQY